MILTPQNSTNPHLWGKDLQLVRSGQVVKVEVPRDIDFIQAIYPKDPVNAKTYFKDVMVGSLI